jgi:hypothetical protein
VSGPHLPAGTRRMTLFLITPPSETSKRKAVHIRVVLVCVSMTTCRQEKFSSTLFIFEMSFRPLSYKRKRERENGNKRM